MGIETTRSTPNASSACLFPWKNNALAVLWSVGQCGTGCGATSDNITNPGFLPFLRETLSYTFSNTPPPALDACQALRYKAAPFVKLTSPPARELEVKSNRKCSVRIPHDLCDRVDAEAASLGCTPSDVIRQAIERHLDGVKLLHGSKRRHLRVTEYMQVALDAIIRKDHPEMRDTLVLETDRRMKLHHGA